MKSPNRRRMVVTLLVLAASAGACADQSPTAVESSAVPNPRVHADLLTMVVAVAVYPTSATIDKGQYRQFSALVLNGYGQVMTSPPPITWTSSNTAAATVNYRGVAYGRGSGTTTITATAGGHSGHGTLTVLASAPVASIKLTPTSLSEAVGQSKQIAAVPLDASGTPLSGYTITWTSSNSAVARVYSNGVVKGIAAGSATITAAAGGKLAKAAVTITASAPTSSSSYTLTVFPSSATLAIGQYRQASAIELDSSGHYVYTTATPTWSSSNSAVAKVSATGVIKALSAGSATIRASLNGLTATAQIYVTAALK